MQAPPDTPIYEFGDFELDSQRRVLVSRADRQPVDITGRVLDALVYFVERPGQLIDKKSLMDALWPHVVVEEGNLTQTIHTLRRVLGETAGEHRYIATAPGRGYRFVADVRARTREVAPEAVSALPSLEPAPTPRRRATDAEHAPGRSARSKALVLGVVTALVLLAAAAFVWRFREPAQAPVAAPATPPSIAVLPFVDMSAEQDQAHFADGLSEEILNLLAKSDGMRVIARTSSFSFKGQSVDIGTIAQRLSATHVLEGSVRKAGDRVRITAQLIDASTSGHLWSETYDRELRDIFAVQSEIAAAVADSLHITLGAAGPRRVETRSTEAYDHYLQGRHLFNRRSGDDVLQAKTHFEKAVELDPEYARAWAALAGVYLVVRYEGTLLPDHMKKWKAAAERGVALAPDLAEARVRLAQYYWHVEDGRIGDEQMNAALKLDPTEPLLIGVRVSDAIGSGRMDEAIDLQRRVVAQDPLSATSRGNLGIMLAAAGRMPEAEVELERALELSPSAVQGLSSLADVYLLQGRFDDATSIIERIPDGIDKDQRLAILRFARGDETGSDAALAPLIELAGKPGFDPAVAVAIAEVYASRNDVERAFTWLQRAHERAHSMPGFAPSFVNRDTLQITPYLAPLRADPRWAALLKLPPGAPHR